MSASNLTERQRQTLYIKALDVPYSPQGFRAMDDTGSIVYLNGSVDPLTFQGAMRLIDNLLASIVNTSLEVELMNNLDCLYNLGNDNIKIVNGSFGGELTGVYYSSEDEKANYVRDIRRTVPFWKNDFLQTQRKSVKGSYLNGIG